VASAPVNKTWYRIAVARAGQPAVLLAAQGEHLGVALAAAEHHVGSGARALAVEVAPGNEVPLGESVGKHHMIELGASTEVFGFPWPPGVIPQLGRTQPLAAARAGFAEHPDPKLFILEAQVAGDTLVDTFLGMIERLPMADNLEVRVLDHFEDRAQTDVWLTSRINAKKILAFLDDHDDELITNGHIQISIYIRKHKATLRLTEHKTVVWIAEDRELVADVARWFGELKVPRIDKLERITSVPHFHFRGAKSKDRKKLGEELFRQRLRRVDKLKTAQTAPAP
jgi:hypothetical protein